MESGQVLCLKTTGELVYLITETDRKTWKVRRPTMTRDGIMHNIDEFFESELETVEAHLRHELQEMILKAKLQKEVLGGAQKDDPEEATKIIDFKVN